MCTYFGCVGLSSSTYHFSKIDYQKMICLDVVCLFICSCLFVALTIEPILARLSLLDKLASPGVT